MKKNLRWFVSVALLVAVLMGFAVPASAFYSLTFDYGGFIDDRHESVPGVWDDTVVTYIKAGSNIEISRYSEYQGEIQTIWVSVAGANDKVYFFERGAADSPFESVVIPFTSGQTKDGKTINLSDPNKVYAVTVQATESDGSKLVSTDFYRVVNEVNGEYVINDEAVYANPLIVKSGLDYDSVILRDDGYFEIETGGKYGLLDSMGNEIIAPIYDRLGELSDGMMRVGNSIDGSGDWDSFKWGFVNVETGKLTIPTQYDYGRRAETSTVISSFSNGLAVLMDQKEIDRESWDASIGFVIESTFEIKCGLIDKKGNMTLPLSDIEIATTSWTEDDTQKYHDREYDLSDNRVVAKQGNKWVVMDTQGRVLFQPNFRNIQSYHNGFAIVESDKNKYGFIDTQGHIIAKPKYDDVENFRNGYAIVKNGGHYGMINQQGELVVPIIYDFVDSFCEDMACVGMKVSDAHDSFKYGYVNTTGNLIIPLIYDARTWNANYNSHSRSGEFYDGLACVALVDERFNDFTTEQRKYGYIDRQGNIIIPMQYSYASDFSNGVAKVATGTPTSVHVGDFGDSLNKAIDARLTELEIAKSYGFIDTSGNVILSAETYFPFGTERFYVDKINGEYAIMRNPVYRETATPNRSTVLVNGEQVAFDAYTINQNNYFKLRDLAKVLSGTGKQFEVTWDGSNNAINMLSGQPYTTVGGELAQGDGTNKTASINTATIYLDGQPVSLLAYTINQNNYFKLRDVGVAFDFDVTWDGARNTIVIDTTKSYTPD